MIVNNEKDFFWVCIDTEEWIKNRCGEPLEYEGKGGWAQEEVSEIEEFLSNLAGCKIVKIDRSEGNTYNHESDLESDINFVFFCPEEQAHDWIYANNLYVAIEGHLGGDVRGNYSRVELYGPIQGEYFFDWMLSWDVQFSNGEPVEDTGEYSAGYHPHPGWHLARHIKGENPQWSERYQCFVGWHIPTKRVVKILPYFPEI